jgi:hypothetical protein
MVTKLEVYLHGDVQTVFVPSPPVFGPVSACDVAHLAVADIQANRLTLQL